MPRQMHHRIDAGTDVAMIGAWDASRGGLPFSADQQRKYHKSLEKEAAAGHIFLIRTGADGGGPVDVYVDEPLPQDARKLTHALRGEYLIAVPTGQLVVAGAEQYRADGAADLPAASIVNIPAGDYSVRCYVATEEAQESPGGFASIAEAEAAVLTDDERAYYRKAQAGEYVLIGLGWLIILAFVPIARMWGWKIALPVTLATVVPYFYWLDRRTRRRTSDDPRWREINKKIGDAWSAAETRTFALELKRVQARTGLTGGSVDAG